MKTIREHLNDLPPLYRDIAIHEAEKYRYINSKTDTLGSAIGHAFDWDKFISYDFWEAVVFDALHYHYMYNPIMVHTRENNRTSQEILDENRTHFTDQTRRILIELLKGKTLNKTTGLSGNISSRISDLIRLNDIPIKKGRKLDNRGRLIYFTYTIEPQHRKEIAKRFGIKI